MRTLASAFALTVLVGFAPGAGATSFTLSEFSNNSTSPSVLDATVDFAVAAGVLTISLTNTTEAGDLYDLNQLYFTTTGDVVALALTGASGSVDGANLADWGLQTDVTFGAFGLFDYGLLGPQQGSNDAQVTPGETQTLTLSITCALAATCDASDFGSELSTNPPGSIPVFVAAKFVNGPGDNSAGGGTATASEPALGVLLLSGLAAVAGTRRRTR